jgi:hypothetical protein
MRKWRERKLVKEKVIEGNKHKKATNEPRRDSGRRREDNNENKEIYFSCHFHVYTLQ